MTNDFIFDNDNIKFIRRTKVYKNPYDHLVLVWKVEVQNNLFGYTGVSCEFCGKDFTNEVHIVKAFCFCKKCADNYYSPTKDYTHGYY